MQEQAVVDRPLEQVDHGLDVGVGAQLAALHCAREALAARDARRLDDLVDVRARQRGVGLRRGDQSLVDAADLGRAEQLA